MGFARYLVLSCSFVSAAAYANVNGIAHQNFNATTDGLDFVTVHSSQTLKPGIVNLGAFLNYAVNSLPYLDSKTQSRVKLTDTLLSSDLNIGIGLAERWDIGLSFPHLLAQDVQDQGDIHGEFANTGSTEIRANSKFRFLGDDTGGLAAVASVNFNRVIDDPYTGNDAGPTLNLELVADTTWRHFRLGVNGGRRYRRPGTQIPNSPIQPLRDQWIASAAASYHVPSLNTKFIAEVFGSSPAEERSVNLTRNLTSSELLIGAKHDVSTNLALHAGGGTALARGVSSPDWRLYVGLNYTLGPLWRRQTTVESVDSNMPREEQFRVGNILFEFDSAKLADNAPTVLAPLVSRLRERPFKLLVVEGHTDSVGRAAYNLNLSQLRAESVRAYLIEQGFSGKKIRAEGYGAERPIADNANYQGRQANRRVEFRLTY